LRFSLKGLLPVPLEAQAAVKIRIFDILLIDRLQILISTRGQSPALLKHPVSCPQADILSARAKPLEKPHFDRLSVRSAGAMMSACRGRLIPVQDGSSATSLIYILIFEVP